MLVQGLVLVLWYWCTSCSRGTGPTLVTRWLLVGLLRSALVGQDGYLLGSSAPHLLVRMVTCWAPYPLHTTLRPLFAPGASENRGGQCAPPLVEVNQAILAWSF